MLIGYALPNVLLKNKTQKRQTQMRRSFPDALDLMVICVESGMSVEKAFIKADEPLVFVRHMSEEEPDDPTRRRLVATVNVNGVERTIEGHGNGPIDAFVDAIRKAFGVDFRIVDYHQHATGAGADAQSACYFEVQAGQSEAGKGATRYGAALDANIVVASLKAVCSAFNRSVEDELLAPSLAR